MLLDAFLSGNNVKKVVTRSTWLIGGLCLTVCLCVSLIVCFCFLCVCVYFCVSADIFVKRMMTRSTWLIGGLCPHPGPISGHSGQSIKQCNRPSDAGPGNHAGFSVLKNYLSATEPSLFVPPVSVGRLFNSCSYQTWSATPVIHENTTENSLLVNDPCVLRFMFPHFFIGEVVFDEWHQ